MEELKDRLKKVRLKLGLTQTEFGKRIGTVQNTITGYESGRRNPSGPVIASICNEFKVNEDWLRFGTGGDDNMFMPGSESELDALAKEYGLSEPVKIAVKEFVKLDPKLQAAALEYMETVIHSIDASKTAKIQKTSKNVLSNKGLDKFA